MTKIDLICKDCNKEVEELYYDICFSCRVDRNTKGFEHDVIHEQFL